MGDLVAVKRCLDPAEAHVLRSYLDAHGIPATLDCANMIGLMPFYAFALGGVQILVPESKFKKSEGLLNEIPKNGSISPCPKCSSERVFRGMGLLNLFGAFWAGCFGPRYRATKTCCDCGHEWRKEGALRWDKVRFYITLFLGLGLYVTYTDAFAIRIWP